MTIWEWIKAGLPMGLFAGDPFPGLIWRRKKEDEDR